MNNCLKSNLEYQRRINKALEYVRDNLDRVITLKEVARAACFSPYHFHRIFSAFMGETLGEYITRKKLERAAIKLAYSPEATVTKVAFDYGYASVSSFSKAFNQYFGCRPTRIIDIKRFLQSGSHKPLRGCLKSTDRLFRSAMSPAARSDDEGLATLIRTGVDQANGIIPPERREEVLFKQPLTKTKSTIDADRLYVGLSTEERVTRFKEIDSRVTIRSIDKLELVYITNPNGYDLASITDTWKTLMELVEDNNINSSDIQRFSLSHDHPGITPPSQCRYDACLKLPDKRKDSLNLPKTTIPSGRYAIFPVEGPMNSILNQYLEFYTVWMPSSGYEPDDFPVLEHYLPDCREDHVEAELWAKIKRLPSL